jgi:hypothetical protein
METPLTAAPAMTAPAMNMLRRSAIGRKVH